MSEKLLLFGFVGALIISANSQHQDDPDLSPATCAESKMSERDITKVVFSKYTSTIERPRSNAQHAVAVNFTMAISSIVDVLESEHIVRVKAILALLWLDQFHRWDYAFPLNCIPYIVLPADQLWRPDIAQINDRAGRYTLLNQPGEKVRLYNNGFVSYSPGAVFDAFCSFDFRFFPFDVQHCSIQIESWRYSNSYVTFTIGGPTTFHHWWENDQWSVVKTEERLVHNTFADMTFDRVEFHFDIKRKPLFSLLNVIIPGVVISLAQMAVFTLSLADTFKMLGSSICLLSYLVLQMKAVDFIPQASTSLPLISICMSLQTFYMVVCLLGEGLVFMYLSRADDNDFNAPTWLRRCSTFFGNLLSVPRPSANKELPNSPPSEIEHFAPSKKQTKQTSLTGTAEKRPRHSRANEADVMKASFSEFTSLGRMRFSEDSIDDTISHELQLSVIKGIISNEMQQAKEIISQHVNKADLEVDRRNQWLYAATVVNRLTCCFYVIATVTTPIIIALAVVAAIFI